MNNYFEIIKHYEKCFNKYGDSHLGVDWPDDNDARKRYEIMLEVIKETYEKVSVVDFGCGASHFFSFLDSKNIKLGEYIGIEISEIFFNFCIKKFPQNRYFLLDILHQGDDLPIKDYYIMNGVFTEKINLSDDEMFDYFKKMILIIFKASTKGMAFNLMSKNVDWEREDLFHVSFDKLTDFLTKNVSKNFVIRNDYGLFEYTTYVYK
jgi:hypothetical protein